MPVKEWLSEDTWKLVQERRNLKRSRRESTDNQRHYKYLCRETKRRSQCDKGTYLVLTEYLQGCGGSTSAKENKGDLRQCAEDHRQIGTQSAHC